MQAIAVLSEFGMVASSSFGNRVSYANAMNDGTSAAEEDNGSKEEIQEMWDFVSSKLFNNKINGSQNAKEKI